MKQPTISWAITVCNEHEELNRLLLFLINNVNLFEDEIVVQGDGGNVTAEVYEVLEEFRNSIKYIEFPLNRDFASFKNNLIAHCKKDYILQLDADELITEEFLDVRDYLIEFPDIEVFALPRMNIVYGLTDEWIEKWGWNVVVHDGMQLINPPDQQQRLFLNNGKIRYKNPVHEVLTGFNGAIASLPFSGDFKYYLRHPKQLDRQIKQNEFYKSISK